MLNDEDINKLTKAFGEIFATKQDFQRLEEKNKENFSYLSEFKNETKENIRSLKVDLAEFKKEAKEDIKDLRTDLAEFKKEASINILDLKGENSFIRNDISEMKNDMADLKELVQGLIVSTDNIAKAISNLSVEYAAIATQLTRHELWIKQIAEKVGLKLSTD